MRRLLWLLLISACAAAAKRDDPLVDFQKLHPAAILDIRYATPNNFTGKAVYPAARCLLRKPVAKRLASAARDLEARGLRLKVYDCYRPLSVQREFWRLVPDERYVADPAKGSRHNRGAAVDVGLAGADGRELEMPSAYDDFSEKAHRGFMAASPQALKNRELLDKTMARHKFAGLATEWWHFDADGWERYSILDEPMTEASKL